METLSTAVSASSIQMDFMKLLVAQMKNQNPLEPLDNTEMASQLAQFSQLQQLEEMNGSLGQSNSNFEEILDSINKSYAYSLIGKTVSFITEDESGEFVEMSGTLKKVLNDPNGGCVMVVGVEEGMDYTVTMDGIVSVEE